MAQKVNITLIDDTDGSRADHTIEFGLDGVNYEIDLSNDNAGRLRDALAPWVSAGRRVGGRKRASSAPKPPRSDLDDIRQWARANGYTVSDRGRVAQDVIDAYDNRHATTPADY